MDHMTEKCLRKEANQVTPRPIWRALDGTEFHQITASSGGKVPPAYKAGENEMRRDGCGLGDAVIE